MFIQVARNSTFAVLVAAALEAALFAPALAAGVPAGTAIENTASASFEAAGVTATISSNTVTVMVDELIDVATTTRDAGPVAVSQGSAVLTFELTNLGNGPEAFQLSAESAVIGNDFDTIVTGIAIDSNRNGAYDPGVDALLPAPYITAGLAPDEALTTFVLVTVPTATSEGQHSRVSLRASAVTGTGAVGTVFVGTGVRGGDAIVGMTGANSSALGDVVTGDTTVVLSKSASFSDPYGGVSPMRGARIAFSLTAQVVGSGSVEGLSITDAVPAGATYAPGTLALDGTPLTDISGDDAGAADGNGIRVAIGAAAGGTSHQVTFAVVIN